MQTRTFPGLGFDPAPGSVADVEAVLTRLADVSSVVDGSARGLRRAARGGGWHGAAASAYRSGTTRLAGGLDDAVTALRSAARAVSAWQTRLVANQRAADELESAARPLRYATDPAAADALARVLDQASRLQARHLREAAAAAAAIRSAADAGAGWPAESAARLSGRVTAWTGAVAAGLVMPGRPVHLATAGPVGGLPVLPGEEGGFGHPQVPDLPGGPVQPAMPPVLDGLGEPRGSRLPWLPIGGDGPALPSLPVVLPAPDGTVPAGWLDTGPAPAVRPPLDPLPRPFPDPTTPALANPADPGPRGTDPALRPGSPIPRGEVPGREESAARPGATRPDLPGRSDGPVRSDGPSRGEPLGRAPRHDVVARADGPRGDARPEIRAEARPEAPARGEVARGEVARGDGNPRGDGGRGGEAPGHGRPGGHAALGTPAAPGGPALPADPTGRQGGPGGAIAAPAQPAPAPDQTVGQQAVPAEPGPPPAAEQRPAAPAVDRSEPADRPAPRGPAPEPARVPETGRAAEPGRPTGFEPGRTTGADPRPTAPAAVGAERVPAKVRADDADLAALVGAPVPGEPDRRTARPDSLRAFLLTRPGARPVLVLVKPGSDREPLFRTGLTPCASPLPGCAAPLPATGPPAVY